MQVVALSVSLIRPKDNLVPILLRTITKHNVKLEDRDIIAISSKALAIAQGQIIRLNQISCSRDAIKLAKEYILKPQLVELILREADKILGGSKKALLTIKNGILTVNAGIDTKNAPKGYAALWPRNPHHSAQLILCEVEKETQKNIGIIIVDSVVAPLRMGTRGLALAIAGFKPVQDCRNRPDLYQKPLQITRHSLADDLASTAHLLMGETNEKIPFVLIKDAPAEFTTEKYLPNELQIPHDQCAFAQAYMQKT
ncbi:MAG: coenzyme F420-0:L-glutamate ligase [Candidatus Bathyarchaeota archaeon]|nr:MAG: coenzyme F420-0:L-glutamate ligase [Candidatus Bathyarchaeota archaeon]